MRKFIGYVVSFAVVMTAGCTVKVNGEVHKFGLTGEETPPEKKDGDKKPEAGGKEAAKAKVDEAGKAGEEGRWLAARALYAAALEADDLVDGGDSGLAQADNEIQALYRENNYAP